MTDHYGNDSSGHGEHEHDDSVHHEGEQWQHDQQPIIDDFDDKASSETYPEAGEETDPGMVVEEEHHEQANAAVETKPARRSLFLPLAAVLALAAIGGGYFFLQSGSNDTGLPQTMNVAKAPTLKPPTPKPVVTEAVAPKTMSAAAEIQSAGTSAKGDNGVATPVQTPPTDLVSPNQAVPPIPVEPPKPVVAAPPAPVAQPSAVAAVAAALPATVTQSMPTTPVNAPAIPAPTIPANAVPAVTKPVPAADTKSVSDARLTAMADQIDQLQKSLQQVNQQLSQVMKMTVSTGVTAASITSDLNVRLGKLEQQIAAQPKASAAPSKMAVTSDSQDDSTPMPSPHISKKKNKPAAVKKASVAASEWYLRAAVPGEAWLADSPSSHELRDVKVGDTVTGLGRIKAIRQVGDAWIVEGTNGSVK